MTTEDFLQEHLEISHFYSDIYEETVCFSKDVQKAMKEYTKLKCQELLLLVAEKVRIIEDGDVDNPYEEYFLDLGGSLRVDKDSILNAVDLETFCS